jgi:hypothetical protein
MDEKWERVGKALQDDAQYVVDDHLPERWIELIKRLNAEEDAHPHKHADW